MRVDIILYSLNYSHTVLIFIQACINVSYHFRISLYRLTSLVESLRANHDSGVLVDRAPAGPTAHIHSGILQVRVSRLSKLFNPNRLFQQYFVLR